MKNTLNALKRAELKISHHNGRQWVGYVTAVEALALLEDGAKPNEHNLFNRDKLEERKRKGQGGCFWFYFYPNKKQLARWLPKTHSGK